MEKVLWMAATPYLMVLLIVVNGNFLGHYELHFFGVQLSLLTLLPYLIYHFVNRDHDNAFIATHTRRAMAIFLPYLVISILIGIAFSVIGIGFVVVDLVYLTTAGFVGAILMLALLIVVGYAVIVATLGSIRAFRSVMPDKSPWPPSPRAMNKDPDRFNRIDL